MMFLMQINVSQSQATRLSNPTEPTEANMFANHHIAKGFAAALMLTLIGSAPALAAAPIEYLQYDLTPYFKLMMGSSPAYQYWRSSSEVESSYHGLFDYAPGAVVHASPMVEAAPLPSVGYVPYFGYDLTPYYNLAPGCPLSNLSDDLAPIC
jgi:hypothetical protein